MKSNIYMKNRIAYLDIGKALAIFLVILGDVAILYDDRGVYTPLSTFVHSFHTAFFMFISGYFFCNALKKEKKEIVLKNIRHLLLPYISWSVICLFLVTIPNHGVDNYVLTIKEFVFGGFLRNYWYIKCLFLYLITTYFLIKLLKNTFAGFVASYLLFTLLPSVFNTSFFIPYFVAGYYSKRLLNEYCSWKWIAFSFVLIIVIYCFWDPDYNYNIGESMFFVPYVVRTCIGCTVSVFLAMLLKKVIYKNGTILDGIAQLGTYTLGIYCCREIFYSGYVGIYLNNLGLGNSMVYQILVTLFALSFSYILCRIIDKIPILSFFFLGTALKK